MRARTLVPVAALLGALVLNASVARGQPAAQAPSPSEPKVVHEPRRGLVLAGILVSGPTYLLQVLAAAGISASATDSTCTCYSKEAQLMLIPVVGPWLSNRAAPPQEQGSSLPLVIYGGVEAAGVAMLVVGLIGHDVPQEPTPPGRSLTLLPLVTPRAEGLSLSMRW